MRETLVTEKTKEAGMENEGQVALGSPNEANASNGEQGVTVAPSNEQSNETQSNSNPTNDTAWIGAVKKKERQKGHDEGYQKAVEEIQNLMNKDNAPPANTQLETHQSPPPNPDSPVLDPNQIAAQAVSKMKSDFYNQVDARARQSFSDYDEKIDAYNQQVEQYVKSPHTQGLGQEMAQAMLMAAEVGKENLVYKLATDENFRNEILSTNQRLWHQKMIAQEMQKGNPQLTEAQKMASQRVNGEPTQNMSTTASYGELSEPSWAELRRNVRNN